MTLNRTGMRISDSGLALLAGLLRTGSGVTPDFRGMRSVPVVPVLTFASLCGAPQFRQASRRCQSGATAVRRLAEISGPSSFSRKNQFTRWSFNQMAIGLFRFFRHPQSTPGIHDPLALPGNDRVGEAPTASIPQWRIWAPLSETRLCWLVLAPRLRSRDRPQPGTTLTGEGRVCLTCLEQPLHGRFIISDVQGSQAHPEVQDMHVGFRRVQLEGFPDVRDRFVRPPRVDFDAAELGVRSKVIGIQRKCVVERSDRLVRLAVGSQQRGAKVVAGSISRIELDQSLYRLARPRSRRRAARSTGSTRCGLVSAWLLRNPAKPKPNSGRAGAPS